MQDDLFRKVMELNGLGYRMSTRNERNLEMACLLRQMDVTTLMAVSRRLRLHKKLHELIATLLYAHRSWECPHGLKHPRLMRPCSLCPQREECST